jgi:ribosome-associated protein
MGIIASSASSGILDCHQAGCGWSEQGAIDIASAGPGGVASTDLLDFVMKSLDDDKAVDPIVVDLAGKTSIADFMVVASGTSQRHISSMAEKILHSLKERGMKNASGEGLGASDWVLIDAGDVIIHLFKPETRSFYDIEKLWSVEAPKRLVITPG